MLHFSPYREYSRAQEGPDLLNLSSSGTFPHPKGSSIPQTCMLGSCSTMGKRRSFGLRGSSANTLGGPGQSLPYSGQQCDVCQG
jgi:hypothetical protein